MQGKHAPLQSVRSAPRLTRLDSVCLRSAPHPLTSISNRWHTSRLGECQESVGGCRPLRLLPTLVHALPTLVFCPTQSALHSPGAARQQAQLRAERARRAALMACITMCVMVGEGRRGTECDTGRPNSPTARGGGVGAARRGTMAHGTRTMRTMNTHPPPQNGMNTWWRTATARLRCSYPLI